MSLQPSRGRRVFHFTGQYVLKGLFILSIVGLVGGCIQLSTLSQWLSLRSNGSPTTATLIEIDPVGVHRGLIGCRVVYQFGVPTDAGEQYIVTKQTVIDDCTHQIGEHINVIYLPNHPSTALADGDHMRIDDSVMPAF